MEIMSMYLMYLSTCDDNDDILTFEEYTNQIIRMEQYGIQASKRPCERT